MTSLLGDYVQMAFGFAFKSARFTEDPQDIRLLRGDNIAQGRLRWQSAKRWPKTERCAYLHFELRLGDVVLAMDRPWIEAGLKYATIRQEDLPALLVQRVARLRGGPNLDQGFLGYLIGSDEFSHHVRAIQTGSAVPHISGAQIARFVIPELPSLLEQREIAATLGALDDKIESNRRQDALLARLIPALFQARVSAENRRPLAEIATCVKGVSYRSADLAASRTALVTLKSFDRNGGYKRVGLKPYIGPYKPAQELAPGELAVAQTDLTQAADVVGRVIRLSRDESFEALVASLDLVIVRPLPGVPVEFLYGVMLNEDFREHCRCRTSGTTVLHLASDAIARYRAPLPDPSVREAYASEIRPLLARRDALASEQAPLTGLRDALLPELLSGRIRVPEAREAVQSAS